MSKGNMLLGHARGKVGDLVFSRSGGEQIVRARAAVVKNPQTEAQTIQRILLNTVAQAYSKMQAICDHSFEGVQAGQPSMSRFMSKNLGMLRAQVAEAVANQDGFAGIRGVVPIGYNGMALNDFIVSQGSLPEINPYFEEGEVNVASLAVGGNTYQQVIDTLGLQRGDQLTFGLIRGSKLSNTIFEYVRVILDPRYPDGTAAPLSVPFVVENAINLPSERNEGAFRTLAVSDTGVLTFNFAFVAAYSACFVIASRKGADGNWKRSNSTLVISDLGVREYPSLETALQMFQTGDVGTLNDRYLNNAGQGNIVTTSTTTANTHTFKRVNGVTVSETDVVTLSSMVNVQRDTVNYWKGVTINGDTAYVMCGNQNSTKFGRFLIDGGTADYASRNGENDALTIAVVTEADYNWLIEKGMSQSLATEWQTEA